MPDGTEISVESILVVAQGQAKANEVLSRSISPILVQYKGVEKWNGGRPICRVVHKKDKSKSTQESTSLLTITPNQQALGS